MPIKSSQSKRCPVCDLLAKEYWNARKEKRKEVKAEIRQHKRICRKMKGTK